MCWTHYARTLWPPNYIRASSVSSRTLVHRHASASVLQAAEQTLQCHPSVVQIPGCLQVLNTYMSQTHHTHQCSTAAVCLCLSDKSTPTNGHILLAQLQQYTDSICHRPHCVHHSAPAYILEHQKQALLSKQTDKLLNK